MPAPTIYVIAGCNGAGKTTFAKEFLPSISVVRFLNADEIARGLSPLRPEAVAFKAGRLLLSELHELIERRETFALESTLSGRTYVNIFKQAKQWAMQSNCISFGFPMFAKQSVAFANEWSKADTMFPRRASSADLAEAFITFSMTTRR
jgi:adenylate kinase family enzyme